MVNFKSKFIIMLITLALISWGTITPYSQVYANSDFESDVNIIALSNEEITKLKKKLNDNSDIKTLIDFLDTKYPLTQGNSKAINLISVIGEISGTKWNHPLA